MAMKRVLNFDHIYNDRFKDKVYPPSEDTFVLADAIIEDFDNIINNKVYIALEIGSGSGYISTLLMLLYTEKISEHNEAADNGPPRLDILASLTAGYRFDCVIPQIITVDLNPIATDATHEMALLNGVSQYFDCLCMDLFSMFVKSKKGLIDKHQTGGMFDLILFNPPYVPSDSSCPTESQIDLAWNGGKEGREVIDRFLESINDYLSPNGIVYMLLEKQNNIAQVLDLISHKGFNSQVELRLCEHLRVRAPHIFNRNQPQMSNPPVHMPQPKAISPYNVVMNPTYSVDGTYQHQIKAGGSMNVTSNEPAAVPTSQPTVGMPPFCLHVQKNIVWQGKLGRNGKRLIDTMAVALSGNHSNILNEKLDIINITHRLKWEEASKNTPLAGR
ncbi:bifunctional Eukaryotic-archaeal PrmC-related/DNA methylase, partial [Babesia duncani]